MSKFRPRGQEGSFFAEWDGNWYHCVPTHWRCGRGRLCYDEPHARLDTPKWIEYIKAVQVGKKVIETDNLVPADKKKGTWNRLGYIDLFEIDNIEITPTPDPEGYHNLRFRFAKRLAAFPG